MGYLVCDNCEGFYELGADESPEDFVLECNCGGSLEHVPKENYKPTNDPANDNESNRVSRVSGKSYAEKKSSKFNRIIIFGLILAVSGFIGYGLGFTFLSILGLLGLILALYGYGGSLSWNKGIMGETIVAEYLNTLPEEYIIFNDVKFPGSRGNLDHVVVSRNGIFVVETKNIDGFFLVNDREWLYKKDIHSKRTFKRSASQPGRQVMANVTDLRKYLYSKGVDVNEFWINPIVALVNDNFAIKKPPKNYEILKPSSIPEVILNKINHVESSVANEIVSLLEPHSIEMSYQDELIN